MVDMVNSFLDKNRKLILFTSLAICTLISCLLFNIKITEGTDDSIYILSAWKFLKGDSFPTWHGSFYQIFLSFFIWLFGLRIVILKLVSLLLIVFHLYWFNKTFQNKVPSYILIISIVYLGVNAHILAYASLTYSEALYITLQIICIYCIFKIIEKLEQNISSIKIWREWLVLGLFMFLIAITRNIGISMVISVIAFFVIYRNWSALPFTIIPFLLFQVLFSAYKKLFWGFSKIGFEDQFRAMFLKDPYNPALGNEDIKGFILRFFENLNQYISKHILTYLGFDYEQSYGLGIIITVICILVFATAFFSYIRKNKYFVLIGIYLFTALCATFVSQQVFWNQGRLVLIYIPLIFVFLLLKIHEIAIKSKKVFIKLLPLISGGIIILLMLINSFIKVKENLPVLSENIKGDKYAGFTTDWINYLKLSKWCSENLPENEVIGCRYPSISFIYGKGREFAGIFNFPEAPVDSFLIAVNRSPSILVISLDEIRNRLSPENQYIFRKNLWAILMRSKSRLGIIKLDKTNKDSLISKISAYKLLHTFQHDSLSYMARMERCIAVYPDSLLNNLRSFKIKYLIDAKINSGVSIGNYQVSINTIKRYLFFIREKYPLLFELIKTEGNFDQSYLFKIHWEKMSIQKNIWM